MEEVIEIYIQYLTPYHEIDKKQIFIEDKKKTFDNKSKVIKIAQNYIKNIKRVSKDD